MFQHESEEMMNSRPEQHLHIPVNNEIRKKNM